VYKYFNIVANFNIIADCISNLENALNQETTMNRTLIGKGRLQSQDHPIFCCRSES
jgi:hypothetical protein